jgi:hypothetical protein
MHVFDSISFVVAVARGSLKVPISGKALAHKYNHVKHDPDLIEVTVYS